MKDENQEKQTEVEPGAAPQKRRNRWKWLLLSLPVLLFSAGLAKWVGIYAAAVPQRVSQADILIYIPPDISFSAIKKILADQHIIDNDIRFDLLARWLKARGRMRAGEYSFPPGLSHKEIIAKLARGEVFYHPLTIPEGYNIFQIAEVLAAGLGYDRNDFLRQVKDQPFIRSLGLCVPSLEGYLFPDTYYITRGERLEKVVTMMVRRFQQVFTSIAGKEEMAAFSASHSLSEHGMVIIASIIEKETSLPEERPLIAAVFLNRLQRGMKLQADPTVIYGIRGFNGKLTRQNLCAASPYNTYMNEGLPAGPIGNPGRQSLAAVLHPAETDYLYFVSKNDGSHYFSKTLPEHNNAVLRYQKAEKGANRKSESEPGKGK